MLPALRPADLPLQLLRQLPKHQFIRPAQQLRRFLVAQRIRILHIHPLRPRQIWRRDDALPVRQLEEALVVDLEAHASSLAQVGDGEHLVADGEDQVVVPFSGLGDAREGAAEGFGGVEVHCIFARLKS